MGQSKVISRINTNEKYMTLNFDDGSNPTRTLSILNILLKYNVKCTFFLTGESICAFPSSARDILQYGHEIGNPTYSNPSLDLLSAAAIETELNECENVLKSATNKLPRPLFRPPYGNYNSTVLDVVGSLGYQYTILWTIDTLDLVGTSSKTMIQNVLTHAEPGAIVLMHVSGEHTVEALPQIIEGLKAKGYTLTTISKMLSLPENPPHKQYIQH